MVRGPGIAIIMFTALTGLMRGQTTIEFILVLVIMLVILATISMPTVERMEAAVTDTGHAIGLASAQQRLITTANELSLAGCGSQKTLTIYIDEDSLTPAKLCWNATHVWGKYFQLDGTTKALKDIAYAGNINFTASGLGSNYWKVAVKKTCATGTQGQIGDSYGAITC